MRANEIVKEIMKEQKMTQQKLAESMGCKTSGAVRMMLSRENAIAVETLLKAVGAMNGQLVIRDADGREYVISE